jgi:intracellular multiplication protein IcmL
MKNAHAAVSRRLSDPDFQAALVTKCLGLTLGLAALLAVSLVHDACVWMNPVKPVYFISDGKGFTRPLTPVDSPIIGDTELLEWTVQAAIAPYNVDYFNYAKELNTASRRFTVHGWNTFASSYVGQGNFDELKRARLLCHAQSQRAAVIHQQPDDHRPRRSHERRGSSGRAGDRSVGRRHSALIDRAEIHFTFPNSWRPPCVSPFS